MIDVFDAMPDGEMLVFQIEEDRLGISIVGDEPCALTTVPDETFFTVTQAVARIEQIMA